jgi:hypothetical protein
MDGRSLESPYSAVDPAITAWAADNGLRVGTNFLDCEVRSVDIERPRRLFLWRHPFQIWVERPEGDGFVEVKAWDRGKQHFSRRVRIESTRSALDDAIEWVRSQS